MAMVSAREYTEPLGLSGETKSNTLVRGVLARSSCSTVTLNSVCSVVSITLGTPPASAIASGYVVQYGAGQITSSPGSHNAANATNTAYLPPTVTNTCDEAHSKPLSRLVFATIASRNTGNPAAGV